MSPHRHPPPLLASGLYSLSDGRNILTLPWGFKQSIWNSVLAVTMAADKKDALMSDIGDSPPSFKAAPTPLLSEQSGSDDGYDEEKNPFRDPKVAEHWKNVYEDCTYECRHVFDPSLTWSAEEEKRLIRKIDWRVCLWAVGSAHGHSCVSCPRSSQN